MSKKYYDEDGNEVLIEEPRKRGGCLKWLLIALGIFVLLGIVGSLASDDGSEPATENESIEEETDTASETVEDTTDQQESASEEETENTEDTETDTTEEVEEVADVPREYSNALRSAENYIDTGMGFSQTGLAEQLAFEDFPQDAIDYAIENIDVDYNEQALISAQNYENTEMGFSDQGLIDQLLFEGFTEEQAQYAINNLE